MTNIKKINEIKDRLSKIRHLSWVSYIEDRDHQSGESFIMVGTGDNRVDDMYIRGATDNEQDFIAHAPEDISFLVGEIEELLKKKDN